MLDAVVLGDRVGFTPGTPAGNYVGLVERALTVNGAEVDRLPAAGTTLGRLGHLGAILHTVRRDRPDVLLYYGHSLPTILWCWAVTRGRRTRFVLHAVEWPPASRPPGIRSWLEATAFALGAFRAADGAVVISGALERKAAETRRRRPIPVLRLPILVDAAVAPPVAPPAAGRYALYCGDLAGYLQDVHTVVDAVAAAGDGGPDLVLVGRAPASLVEDLEQRAEARGLGGRLRVITEVLPYDELLATYAGADLLLAPLPDDERTRCRYPSKLADYLLSGRPVVTSGVGEVTTLLHDGTDAYVAEPGGERFAAAVVAALADPRRDAVGAAGRARALEALDHRRHGARLVAFLEDLVR